MEDRTTTWCVRHQLYCGWNMKMAQVGPKFQTQPTHHEIFAVSFAIRKQEFDRNRRSSLAMGCMDRSTWISSYDKQGMPQGCQKQVHPGSPSDLKMPAALDTTCPSPSQSWPEGQTHVPSLVEIGVWHLPARFGPPGKYLEVLELLTSTKLLTEKGFALIANAWHCLTLLNRTWFNTETGREKGKERERER